MANLTETTPARNGIKGGYWLSKLADQNPPIDNIPPSCFTHVFYASVGLDPQNYRIIITTTDINRMPTFISALRAKGIKSFLSIGGRPDSEIPKPANPLPNIFSSMASTTAGRQSFIKDSVQVARKYGFDGLDLDWEYPNTTLDMENLALLFREWRQYIISEAATNALTPVLLSAAVYFKPSFTNGNIEIVYPIEAINKYVDLVGLRCYDYHTSRDTPVTAAHACLHDRDDNRERCTSFSIVSWINAQLDPSKLLMGLPLYGRTWTLADPSQCGIGAPAIENAMPNRDIRNFDAVTFRTPNYDEPTVSEYSYSGTFWVGYDGKKSIPKKVEFAKTKKIGGYFLWGLQFDNIVPVPEVPNNVWELSEAASNAWDGVDNR